MRRPGQPYCKAGYLKVMVICWLGISQYVDAQTLTNQTNFFIPAGLELHLDGDFVNEGFIQNQGSFFISGNWKNTNVYQGTGRVTLNGDLDQTFFNSKNAVYHLEINGGGEKFISDRLPISSRLDLTLGIVNVSDVDTLLIANGASITGGSTSSFVNGALTHQGVGYKFFPIGINGGYYPLELLNASGINPTIEVEVFESAQPLAVPQSVTVFSNKYWQRKTISGTFLGSPLSIGYTIPDNYTNRHVIDILQSDALDNDFSILGNTRVEYNDPIPMVISDNAATSNVFILGESIPPDGIPGQFYLSTTLSPAASEADNRYARIFGNQLVEKDFQFRVFNRWGLMVYETASLGGMISVGWDGKHKGDYLPSGAYPFIMKAVTKAGEVIEKKGVLSIIN
ncbi:MAG TPA: gliding motility-associated C-terminal domain-containing protein [Chryseolinea sp.]|nr:gliding motility-associated C-terminal domain-containing protein [Chryseolinea sp.]